MNTLHPSIKYIIFLVMLYAVLYGTYGMQEMPQARVVVALTGVIFFSLVGLVGRKMAKDPFVGFISSIAVILGLSLVGSFLL